MLKCWRTGADNWWTTPVALRGKLGAVHRWPFSLGVVRHTVMLPDTKLSPRPSLVAGARCSLVLCEDSCGELGRLTSP
jgi:hypothetical protein